MHNGNILRHGAYLSLSLPPEARAAPVPALVERLGLVNEMEASGHPPAAVAFLRRADGSSGADAMVHVAAPTAGPVAELCAALPRLLPPSANVTTLRGVVRAPSYTGGAMFEFAYAHQVAQQPGAVAPHAFFLPLRKNSAWWSKDWMERHTYFLPRYDDSGRMRSQGHALAAAAGISHLMRRTYRSEGEYEFLTYFECADAGVPVFHEVMAALRDTARNPEWAFVEEGPLWRGRRVASWGDLFE